MKKNNKGFSLVELMIALAISGIVMTALVLLVVQSVNGYGKQTALAQIQSDVDVSLNQISKNVLEADLIKLIKTDDGNIRCYLKKSDDANMWGYYYNKAEKIVYYTNSDESEHVVMSELCDNGLLAEDACWTVVRDTSMISDYVFEKDGDTIKSLPKNPQVVVTLELKRLNHTRSVTRKFTSRNSIGNNVTFGTGTDAITLTAGSLKLSSIPSEYIIKKDGTDDSEEGSSSQPGAES